MSLEAVDSCLLQLHPPGGAAEVDFSAAVRIVIVCDSAVLRLYDSAMHELRYLVAITLAK